MIFLFSPNFPYFGEISRVGPDVAGYPENMFSALNSNIYLKEKR